MVGLTAKSLDTRNEQNEEQSNITDDASDEALLRYQYEKVSRPYYVLGKGMNKQEVWRINRFTGRSEKVVDPLPSKH